MEKQPLRYVPFPTFQKLIIHTICDTWSMRHSSKKCTTEITDIEYNTVA